MTQVLFRIPLTLWIRGTIEKMNQSRKTDYHSWSHSWFETYKELGGKNDTSGTKECPQHAAYGLWRLGRIKNTNIPLRLMSISHIDKEYGKNVSYAILALELLESHQVEDTGTDIWGQVQSLYKIRMHKEPAQSQQGAVTIARALFADRLIVSNQE